MESKIKFQFAPSQKIKKRQLKASTISDTPTRAAEETKRIGIQSIGPLGIHRSDGQAEAAGGLLVIPTLSTTASGSKRKPYSRPDATAGAVAEDVDEDAFGLVLMPNSKPRPSNTPTTTPTTKPQSLQDPDYHRDVESRPDAADNDAYEKIPVEHYGAAMLRGMGWTEPEQAEDERGNEAEKRRPKMLGLGAELPDNPAFIAQTTVKRQRRN